MELYQLIYSPPSRSVRTLAQHIGVKLLLVTVNLMEGEHLKPDFMKMSPFHTIPALNDSGYTLFESRAIMMYLVNKYAPDSNLYPNGLQERAAVDAMIHFDVGTLSPLVRNIRTHMFSTGQKAPPEVFEKSHDKIKCLDDLVANRKFITGDVLTLPDISIAHTFSDAEVIQLDLSKYPNIQAYLARVKEAVPAYAEINDPAMVKLKEMVKGKTRR